MKVTFSHNSTKAGQLMKKLKNFSIKAGWFENAKYGDNKSVAGIAAVQDGGATISHPGGTPYKFGADGKVVFVEKAHRIRPASRSRIRLSFRRGRL